MLLKDPGTLKLQSLFGNYVVFLFLVLLEKWHKSCLIECWQDVIIEHLGKKSGLTYSKLKKALELCSTLGQGDRGLLNPLEYVFLFLQ